ncbi:Crp/Fnr family transcriptional regulator [Robertmurraya sp. 2P01SA]
MRTAKAVSYKNKEIIHHAGDVSDSLYIVKEGKMKIYRLSESGKEQLIRILYPGDFTDVHPLFHDSFHHSFAEAMEDTEVCIIKRTSLQELLIKYPVISFKMLAELSNRLEMSERQTMRCTTEKVETRLALFLIESLGQEGKVHEFDLPMSKKDLASYLGTTPETISRKLTEFEEAGYIEQKGHKRIKILDLERLLVV